VAIGLPGPAEGCADGAVLGRNPPGPLGWPGPATRPGPLGVACRTGGRAAEAAGTRGGTMPWRTAWALGTLSAATRAVRGAPGRSGTSVRTRWAATSRTATACCRAARRVLLSSTTSLALLAAATWAGGAIMVMLVMVVFFWMKTFCSTRVRGGQATRPALRSL
jgi:hypothetical protein